MWIAPTGEKYADKSDAVFHAVLKSRAAMDRVIVDGERGMVLLFAQRLMWITELCDRGRPCPIADELLALAGVREVANESAKV